MKWSKYNLLTRSAGGGWLLYNSLSNSLVEFDESAYLELQSIQSSPDDYDITRNPALFLQLTSMKAIIDADEEKTLVDTARLWRLSSAFSSSILALTLLPTLRCNFDCPYCFESWKASVDMTEEIEDLVVGFAREHEQAQELVVAWFGGEPLLRFDTMVRLTEKLRRLDLPLTASLTTNGYLLDEIVGSKLDELNVVAIQITIDGPEQLHNERRPLALGGDTYATILSNVKRLLELWKGQLHLRVNIDKANQDAFPELYRELRTLLPPDRVVIGTGMVLPPQGKPRGACCLARGESCDFHFALYRQHAIDEFLPFPRMDLGCAATHKNSWVIGPRGEVYKCLQDVSDPAGVVGSLCDSEEWNRKLLQDYLLKSDPFEHEECRECFHLPVCGGGCAYTRVRGMSRTTPNACFTYKGRMAEFLALYAQMKSHQVSS